MAEFKMGQAAELLGVSVDTVDPVQALADECEELSATARELTEQEFAAPTRCTEWNVKELLGHTYRGRMVGVITSNDKLRRRAGRMVRELTGCSSEMVETALRDAGGSAKVAILMLRFGIDADDARHRLSGASEDLAVALGERARR